MSCQANASMRLRTSLSAKSAPLRAKRNQVDARCSHRGSFAGKIAEEFGGLPIPLAPTTHHKSNARDEGWSSESRIRSPQRQRPCPVTDWHMRRSVSAIRQGVGITRANGFAVVSVGATNLKGAGSGEERPRQRQCSRRASSSPAGGSIRATPRDGSGSVWRRFRAAMLEPGKTARPTRGLSDWGTGSPRGSLQRTQTDPLPARSTPPAELRTCS
jgi:hypothetical protein